MHRRQLISAAAAALALGIASRASGQQATPAATPQHFGLPRPVSLGEGIELVDYRIYPSEGTRSIIGEIVSTRDDMVDAPVVLLDFAGHEAGHGAWAVPALPVMDPGSSNLIFGALPPGIETQADLESGVFSLCGDVAAGKLTARHEHLQLSVVDVIGQQWDVAQWYRGALRNDGPETVEWAVLRGLVRDVNGRFVGCTPTYQFGHLAPGESRAFELWSATDIPVPAGPYPLLNGAVDYTTRLFPGVLGDIVAPACAAAFPWNEED